MRLHVGQDIIVREKDVIGIFDLDTSTVSRITKNFLFNQEKLNNTINASDNKLPKSFVLCKEKKSVKIYISLLASNTISRRNK